jgi:phosphoglycerol transferase
VPENNSNINNWPQKSFLIFAGLIIFIALIFRSSGIYPVVLADEYIYSKFSRLLPLSGSTIPGYIYLAIYSVTSVCGDGFLDCARILNALFFLTATPFIYLTARRVCSRGVATFATLLTLLGPINSYTAYFMPESLYFFSFWLFTWFILRLDYSSDSNSWAFGGIIFGFSSLVKPHALFFLPAILIYILYVSREREGEWILYAFKKISVFVAFAFLTKFSIGFLLAGKAGMTIFGTFYTSLASSSTSKSSFQHYLELLALSVESVKGHLVALCLMFSLPLAVAINTSLNSIFSKTEMKSHHRLMLYTISILFVLIPVVALFTASVVGSSPYETNARLHMRYYNFALPLLLLVAASQLPLESNATKLRGRAAIALPIGAAILYAIYTKLAPYTPSLVDSPELRGFTFNPVVFYILSTISLFSLIAWIFKAQIGANIFVYIFMPLVVAFSTTYVNQELRQWLISDVYDRAGIFTKQYLSNEEISKLVIVGSEPVGLFRSLFHLDNPQASLETIPRGTDYELSKIPAGKEWVLVIGDHSLPEKTFFQLPMNGFTLARITGSNTIDFSKSSWPGIIVKARGLSSAEAQGTWSSGDIVTLEFSTPLPEKFAIHLVAHAFGPNVEKEFVAHVGVSSKSFTLGASLEERVLEFINLQRSKTIKIDIPSPISPKELGVSGDERIIGIKFVEMRIVAL